MTLFASSQRVSASSGADAEPGPPAAPALVASNAASAQVWEATYQASTALGSAPLLRNATKRASTQLEASPSKRSWARVAARVALAEIGRASCRERGESGVGGGAS